MYMMRSLQLFMFKIRTQFIFLYVDINIYILSKYMVILLKKQKGVTNIHLNVKVINKGPSELFFFGVKTF